jgi:Spy/CpxP family protein refolding chaperone
MGQVKDVYMTSAKSDASKKDASKKNAKESLKAIHDKYNAQINTILTPEQVKVWKRMQKDWKDDLIVPTS